MSSKVDKVIQQYIEAAGISLEQLKLTPDEEKAVKNVQQHGAQTDGGKELAKVVDKKKKKQSQDASTAARKIKNS